MSKLASVMVDDQARALDFYTDVRGFAVKARYSDGRGQVVDDRHGGTELLFEPAGGLAEAPGLSESTVQCGHLLSC
jgi:catechol 2,3-dioxygenase-like lactoylglutathione lyase family enzyme